MPSDNIDNTDNTFNMYREELETAIGVNLANLSNTEKFESVFEHPHSLGRFIYKAFQKRREKLYKS